MAADPDMIVGAGTVTDPDQVDAAVAAGARFIVSPGFDARVVRRARQLEVAVYPGIATPTELQAALAEGVDVVKFFPAEPLGGLPMVAALAGPFGGVRFIPTGGIGAARVRDYLAHPAVLAVGGSWMAPAAAIAAGDWARITALTGESVASARG
jgi:2-dehydro-3-deoxyphosphogluconate aldolase/(4S)-4-hydroxy-2-oxoglutarate aldolase